MLPKWLFWYLKKASTEYCVPDLDHSPVAIALYQSCLQLKDETHKDCHSDDAVVACFCVFFFFLFFPSVGIVERLLICQDLMTTLANWLWPASHAIEALQRCTCPRNPTGSVGFLVWDGFVHADTS